MTLQDPPLDLAPPTIAVATEATGTSLAVRISGEVDIATHDRLAGRLAALDLTTYDAVLLDLAGLDFCDSAGVRLLLAFRESCRAAGCTVQVQGARSQPARMLALIDPNVAA